MADKGYYAEHPPTPEQQALIAAALIQTGSRDEYEGYYDYRAVLNQSLREVALAARDRSNRQVIERAMDMDGTVSFFATVRGMAFHTSSSRYVVQLQSFSKDSDELRIEYITTERTDGIQHGGNGEDIAARIDEQMDQRIKVYKHSYKRDGRGYKELFHIEPAGRGDQLDQDVREGLSAELDEHMNRCVGKGQCLHAG